VTAEFRVFAGKKQWSDHYLKPQRPLGSYP
jgi:hypothetical protein